MLLSSTKPQAENFSPNTMAAGPPALGHPSAPHSTAGCCKGPGSGSALPHGPTQLMCHGPGYTESKALYLASSLGNPAQPLPDPWEESPTGSAQQQAVPASPPRELAWQHGPTARSLWQFHTGGQGKAQLLAPPGEWGPAAPAVTLLPRSCRAGPRHLSRRQAPGHPAVEVETSARNPASTFPCARHFLFVHGMGLGARTQASPPHAGRWLDPQLPGPGRDT